MAERFDGSFTQQEPIPEEGIEAALAVLRHGRLHRYNLAEGEAGEAALLEEEFAALVGARYCLAVASGGYAMSVALRAVGARPGDRVLSNAFTLAPVPGAIAGVGAEPVFVETTEDLTIDLGCLESEIARSGARILLLSHMRGHICDMDRLMEICDGAGVAVVEDCAHTMGASWRGVPSGRHGIVGCYSTQTYKHVNSGEGGLIVTDDEEVAARAVMLSGSYMLFGRHRAAPPPEAFSGIRYETPNMSGRMDNLRAAILRPQLARLADQARRWNERYRTLEDGLRGTPGVTIVERPEAEEYVGSSFQFLLPGWEPGAVRDVVARCGARGVELKWFGAEEPTAFTSSYASWTYADPPVLPGTDRVLAGLLDMRVPLTFSLDDCALIARIVREEVSAVSDAEELSRTRSAEVRMECENPLRSTIIFGFDSAWTDNPDKPGAICAIAFDDRGRVRFHEHRPATFACAGAYIKSLRGSHDFSLVAIDQPTVVPNRKGMRPVERLVASPIKSAGGSVLPAFRGHTSMFFCKCAPIWRFLADLGAKQDPLGARKASTGFFLIEVFPALALLSLDDGFADRLPKYNPDNKKTFCQKDWEAVAHVVKKIAKRFGVNELADWAQGMRDLDSPIKFDQDKLDAAICALVGLAWRTPGGPIRCSAMLGDVGKGYMVAPVSDTIRPKIERRADELKKAKGKAEGIYVPISWACDE